LLCWREKRIKWTDFVQEVTDEEYTESRSVIVRGEFQVDCRRRERREVQQRELPRRVEVQLTLHSSDLRVSDVGSIQVVENVPGEREQERLVSLAQSREEPSEGKRTDMTWRREKGKAKKKSAWERRSSTICGRGKTTHPKHR